jgi:intein/homing endonuclease
MIVRFLLQLVFLFLTIAAQAAGGGHFTDENDNEQVIETTDSHPFWVVNKKEAWVEAKDLREGDVFIGANGELSTLVNKERVEFANGITVYNFTVDGNHDYFVVAQTAEWGQTSVLVHNANGYKGTNKFDNIPENISKNARRLAQNETEQAVLDKVKADPLIGQVIMRNLNDPMFSIGTWYKMEYTEKGVTVHYVREIFSGVVRDFKFKN